MYFRKFKTRRKRKCTVMWLVTSWRLRSLMAEQQQPSAGDKLCQTLTGTTKSCEKPFHFILRQSFFFVASGLQFQMWNHWWILDMTNRGGPPVAAGAPRTRPRPWPLSRAVRRCPPGPLILNFKSSLSAPAVLAKPALWRDTPTTLSAKLASRP